ncbi:MULTISPECIES: carboxylate-amine ligase [Rhodomicrobium]|uniref:carboxylate-amine ligase n=1 Tax=Rhodomicrobium TaxID=1068 RepID=UPI000B4BFF04|nr:MULTISPECIES: carboxylate-amine ligase [Rhodomicrobium]
MSLREPSFTLGIEEEYLLVDKVSRDLAADPPKELFSDCEAALAEFGGQVTPEFMRSQIEVGTRVCKTIKEAREDLARLRRTIADCAANYGLAPIAASTHPFAEWEDQQHTDKERYHVIVADLQMIARRMLISGMHVHVGIEDDDLRIDIMNQASYFLPHLLALSTSSPFWRGRQTGLNSFRLAIFDELPRTGLPEHFASFAEYARTVDVLVKSKLIEDGTKIWWDLRPSWRFPTLEMRITDICPFLEDGISIAAMYLCICRMLYRLRGGNQRWRSYSPFLIMENRWRAQRYGATNGLVDFGKSELVEFRSLLDEILVLIREDAEALNCRIEVEHSRNILERGTSAERQVAVFAASLEAGADEREALQAVVDTLIVETVQGTGAETAKA